MILLYAIANRLNGKLYIGQTSQSLMSRIRQHQSYNRCCAMYGAFKKYGYECFTILELCNTDCEESANLLEQSLIANFKTQAPNGYNLRSGGDRSTHSKESKLKMSETQKKIYKDKWTKLGRYPRTGIKCTEEQRKRLSESHKGIRQSDETKERRAAKLKKSAYVLPDNKHFSSIGEAASYLNISHQHASRIAKNGKRIKTGQIIVLGGVSFV